MPRASRCAWPPVLGERAASRQSPDQQEKEASANRASPTCPPKPALRPARWRASRSCPKLGGALVLHEEFAPAASATCKRSASTAIRRRSWSRERPRLRRAHALPVRAARVPISAVSAPYRMPCVTALSFNCKRCPSNAGGPSGGALRRARRWRLFFRGRLPLVK